MTIQELKNESFQQVAGMPEGQLAAEVLMSFALKKTKKELFLEPGEVVEEASLELFWSLVDRFRAGEPVAYLTQNKEFYGLDFYVDKRVLIPRPETELLVDKTLEYAQKQAVNRILDVGTGSGCMAVTLAAKMPDVEVVGVDISGEALEVAAQNAAKNGVGTRVKFFVSDLLSEVIEPFNVVVANLPYIGVEKFNFVSREAKEFEPNVALFGGADGLELYRKLFAQLNERSWKPQLLLGEFGFLQNVLMNELLTHSFPDAEVNILEDYASIPRVFMVGFRQ